MHFLVSQWLLVGCLLSPVGAKARLATAADLPAVNESEQAEVLVDAKGHTKLTVERVIRIEKEEGRGLEAQQSIVFNERTSKLKILSARTRHGSNDIAADLRKMTIEPFDDSEDALSPIRRAKISFPNVRVGSKLDLKYEISTEEVAQEGFCSFLADFTNWYLENYALKIRSELPLEHWLNDPSGVFEIKRGREGLYHVLEARSTATIRPSPERRLALVVSTLKSWEGYARPTINKQEKLLTAELPTTAKRILATAARERSLERQLSRVAASLGEKFRYFGDWRRSGAESVPRSLTEIAVSGFGDCKDLSLMAVAIYRRMGFKADIAWLQKGEGVEAPSADWYRLPVDAFDHAIVRVEAPQGRVYWIDVTEPEVQIGVLSPEIAGRPAFVLNPARPRLEAIPDLGRESLVPRVVTVGRTGVFFELAREQVIEKLFAETRERSRPIRILE